MPRDEAAAAGTLPSWFRQDLPGPEELRRVKGMKSLLKDMSLHTVCEGARCPNTGRCWNLGTATFMIMGDTCTRACHFCAVKTGIPVPLDEDEPRRIAQSVGDLGLKHAVITSVTRDDLADGGAEHFAATVRAIRAAAPAVSVELLVPDFLARVECFKTIAAARPQVIGHNIEMVRRLARAWRPQADHDRSLDALRAARGALEGGLVKSGLMVGLGETDHEVVEALGELKRAGCDVVTIGQYLAPRAAGRQWPVARFVDPGVFDMYRREGLALGFAEVAAGPLVRSSYLAEKIYATACEASGI